MITKKKLHWIKNGTEYSAHLMTGRLPHRPVTPPVCQLAVQVDGQTLYTDDTSVSHIDNMLSFKSGNYTRYVKDIVPTIVIASNIADDPQPYKERYRIDSLSMSMNVSINNQIELQYNYLDTWNTFMILPADATYASLGSGVRIDYLWWRIKIGSWTNEFYQYTGSDSTTRQIPEAQWGV
jgi:hypothetical protein